MKGQTELFNPATGETIGFAETHDRDDLQKMVQLGRTAHVLWNDYSVNERVKLIIKVRDFLIDNVDRIADTISMSNGKTRIDSLATEVIPAAMAVSYYCKNADRFLKDRKLSGGSIILFNKRSKLIRVPYGVIGIISPGNYPFTIPFSEVIMGLLAGNSVILKTSSESQLVGKILEEAIKAAELPAGVFQLINLPGRIAGDAFLESGVNKLFFTGSVAVGKYLMKKASEYLTPLCLELGGKDAMIVCEDADLYRAAVGAVWAAFQNAGQSCGGIERIYVHHKIYDGFMSILKEKTESLRAGTYEDYNSDMGCLTSINQCNTVRNHVDDALAKGAIIFAQSKIPNYATYKNFMPAMVLTNVNHEMTIMKEETFGPVVGVMQFNSYEESINLANDSHLGLTGSVWTKSKSKGEFIARQIKAGAVTINDHLVSHGIAETPWGGFNQSGIGRTHGELGFDEMTQPLVIVKDVLPFMKKNLWWHPFSKELYDGLKSMLFLLYKKNIGLKLKSFVLLMRIFPGIFKKG